jgi:hypothetical protein
MFVYEFYNSYLVVFENCATHGLPQRVGWLNYTKIVQRYEKIGSWASGVSGFFLPLHQNQHKYNNYENETLTVHRCFCNGTRYAGKEIPANQI